MPTIVNFNDPCSGEDGRNLDQGNVISVKVYHLCLQLGLESSRALCYSYKWVAKITIRGNGSHAIILSLSAQLALLPCLAFLLCLFLARV